MADSNTPPFHEEVTHVADARLSASPAVKAEAGVGFARMNQHKYAVKIATDCSREWAQARQAPCPKVPSASPGRQSGQMAEDTPDTSKVLAIHTGGHGPVHFGQTVSCDIKQCDAFFYIASRNGYNPLKHQPSSADQNRLID